MFDDRYLSKIVAELNSKGPAGDGLRQLVAEWQRAPSLRSMLRSKSMKFQSACSRAWTVLWTSSDQDGRSDFMLQRGHIPREFLPPLPKTIPRLSAGAEDKAIHFFVALTLHPNQEKLAGPCERCGKYYLMKTRRRRIYCSKICGTRTTAGVCNNDRIRRERADKLKRAIAALKDLDPKSTDWKHSVSKLRPNISSKFLTRAVGEGARLAGTTQRARNANARDALELLGTLLTELNRPRRSSGNGKP